MAQRRASRKSGPTSVNKVARAKGAQGGPGLSSYTYVRRRRRKPRPRTCIIRSAGLAPRAPHRSWVLIIPARTARISTEPDPPLMGTLLHACWWMYLVVYIHAGAAARNLLVYVCLAKSATANLSWRLVSSVRAKEKGRQSGVTFSKRILLLLYST